MEVLRTVLDQPAYDHSRIFLRPIANPMPMGLLGLAGGTTALSALQLGWVPTAQTSQVGLVVLAVAVPLQLVATVMGFLSRDAVVATGFGTLAVTWLTIGLITASSTPGSRSKVLGLMLFYLAAAVLVSAVAASLSKLVPALVLAVAAARFAVTGVYEYFGTAGSMHTAGWIGVALGALALYAALAIEIESALHRTILPTGRIGAGRRALVADGMDAVGVPHREAGVRGQS